MNLAGLPAGDVGASDQIFHRLLPSLGVLYGSFYVQPPMDNAELLPELHKLHVQVEGVAGRFRELFKCFLSEKSFLIAASGKSGMPHSQVCADLRQFYLSESSAMHLIEVCCIVVCRTSCI